LNHGIRIRNNKELAYKALFYIPERKENSWFVLEKEYALPISKEHLLELFNIINISCNFKLKELIDFNELLNIFKNLNLNEHIKIKKLRHVAKADNCEICVDFIENLGLFVEIEVQDDILLRQFLEKISFRYEEIRHGYTNLYAAEVMKIIIPEFKEKFIKNPDWNYLNGQKELIKKIIDEKNID